MVGLISLALATPVAAQTRPWSGVCVGSSLGYGTVDENADVATIQGVQCLLANVFTVAITIVGLAGFVMLIIGSFRYLLSGGNSKGTESARNTITFAVVGLVVSLSAFIIVNLIASFTGVELIKNFSIPNSNTVYTNPGNPEQVNAPVEPIEEEPLE